MIKCELFKKDICFELLLRLFWHKWHPFFSIRLQSFEMDDGTYGIATVIHPSTCLFVAIYSSITNSYNTCGAAVWTNTKTVPKKMWLTLICNGRHCHDCLIWTRIRCTFMVATGLAEINSLTFPWHFPDCQHKFQSLSQYNPRRVFLQCIQNHREITSFITRRFNIVVLKLGQHKRTFTTSWKLLISCVKQYAKHENK